MKKRQAHNGIAAFFAAVAMMGALKIDIHTVMPDGEMVKCCFRAMAACEKWLEAHPEFQEA